MLSIQTTSSEASDEWREKQLILRLALRNVIVCDGFAILLGVGMLNGYKFDVGGGIMRRLFTSGEADLAQDLPHLIAMRNSSVTFVVRPYKYSI